MKLFLKYLKNKSFCLIMASNFTSRKAWYRRIVSDFMRKFKNEKADGLISEKKKSLNLTKDF